MSRGRGPRRSPGTMTTRCVAPRRRKRESRRSRQRRFRSRRPCARSLHNGPAPYRAARSLRGSRGKRPPPPASQPYLRRSASRTRRRNRHWKIARKPARSPVAWGTPPAENLRPAPNEESASPFGQMPPMRQSAPASDPRRGRYEGEQIRPFAGACPSGSLAGGEDPRISRKHFFLRKFFNHSATIGRSECLAPFGIVEQPGERVGKGLGIIPLNDELLVILAHDALHISNVDRCNGATRRHRLEQCIRHLLCIRRHGKDVKRAKNLLGSNLTGEDDTVGNAEPHRQPLERDPLGPLT